jgi:hypothetical protein
MLEERPETEIRLEDVGVYRLHRIDMLHDMAVPVDVIGELIGLPVAVVEEYLYSEIFSP